MMGTRPSEERQLCPSALGRERRPVPTKRIVVKSLMKGSERSEEQERRFAPRAGKVLSSDPPRSLDPLSQISARPPVVPPQSPKKTTRAYTSYA